MVGIENPYLNDYLSYQYVFTYEYMYLISVKTMDRSRWSSNNIFFLLRSLKERDLALKPFQDKFEYMYPNFSDAKFMDQNWQKLEQKWQAPTKWSLTVEIRAGIEKLYLNAQLHINMFTYLV